MKNKIILFTTLLLSTLFCNSQNFVNLDTYGDSTSIQWIVDSYKPGDTIHARIRMDKDQTNTLDEITLDKTIQFNRISNKSNVYFEVIYMLNLWATPQINEQGINKLITNNVDVNFIEVGNEWYSNTLPENLNWDYYYNVFNPVVEYLKPLHSNGVKFIYPAAPRPSNSTISGGRNEHKIWNDKLKLYLNTQDQNKIGVVWHSYYNQKECSILDTLIEKQTYNKDVYNSYLNHYYSTYFNCSTSKDLWNSIYNYTQNQFPNLPIYLTEFGTDNSGDFRNTWTYGALTFKDMMENKHKFEFLCIHSGIALTGIISPKNSKFDPIDITTTNVRRVEYWGQYLVNQVNKEYTPELQLINNVDKPGTYYFWFVNSEESNWIPNFVPTANLLVTSLEKNYIKGSHYYSTGGYTEWMKNGSVKSQEIKGINTSNNVTISQFEFGYIKIVVESKEILGCTDPFALNYNIEATKDDGSCEYIVLPINDTPSFDLGDDKIITLPNNQITLNVNVIDTVGGVDKYIWNGGSLVNFEGTNTITLILPKISGNYDYCLTVIDTEGLSSSDCIKIIVKEAPKSKITFSCKYFGWLFPNLCK